MISESQVWICNMLDCDYWRVTFGEYALINVDDGL